MKAIQMERVVVTVHMLKAAVAGAVVVSQRAPILMGQMHRVHAVVLAYKCPTVKVAKTRHAQIDRQRAVQDIARHQARMRCQCFTTGSGACKGLLRLALLSTLALPALARGV